MAIEPDIYPWLEPLWDRWRALVADDRLPHALLLSGLPGTGKRAFARRLARAHLCNGASDGPRPCGACRDCGWLKAGSHPDLLVVEPEEDKTELKVDALRELGAALTLTGGSGRRAAIVDPAHAMNRSAANAFLKTLEEPPAGVLLLLVSEMPTRMPATIRSRCQVLAFNPPSPEQGADWLRATGELAEADVSAALTLAGGAAGEALRIAGSTAERDAVFGDLVKLAEGRADPVSVSEGWQKLRVHDVLTWFARWISAGARRGAGVEGAADARLQRVLDGVDWHGLFELYDAINGARHALDTQLRSDLMIESLLIQWCRLTGAGRERA